jgi:uncharacterized protein YggE
MKVRYILATLAALMTLLALAAVACGDDDDDDGGSTSGIRTEKGLTVANMDQFRGDGAGAGDGDDSAAWPGGAPEFDGAGVGGDEVISNIGRAGFSGPSFVQTAGGAGITVQGFGTATTEADSARIEFYFGRYAEDGVPIPEPDLRPGSSGSSGADDVVDPAQEDGVEAIPITEADLQPVIDALVAAGVSRDDIEFVEQGYYDPYWATATLRVKVGNLDSLEGVVGAGTNAGNSLTDIALQSSNVIYTVGDCSSLQQAALGTAMEDAGDNVQTFATALGVTAGEMIGASDLSWYPTDGTGCDSYWGYYPVDEDAAFIAGPTEVSAYAQVAITYAMQ